jgi:ribosomal protein S18 acetylase RimI-like enzyme
VSIEPAQFPFLVEPLAKHHDRSAFASGSPELDAYFRKQARQDVDKKVAVTFVLIDIAASLVAGFYSLASTAVPLGKFPDEVAKKLPKYPLVPATLLARLAIDSGYQGRRLGEYLLMHALEKSLTHSLDVASAAIIVDAKDQSARSFYIKHQFLVFPEEPMRLFLPMKTVQKLFTTRGPRTGVPSQGKPATP